MVDVIYARQIPSTDPRLKRHVNHDSRSWLYRFDTSGIDIQSVRWVRRIPVFDQGNLGSCTGNAGVGALGADPLFATIDQPRYPFTEAGAVQLYSDATGIDGFPGVYPPQDTGSDGLSIAKALKAAGEIAGYLHTFTVNDALKALVAGPLICGIPWYESMFDVDARGVVPVRPSSGVAGGHEIVVDEYDAKLQRVGFTNSWGEGWGVEGRFYVDVDDWEVLLADQGDVISFVPVTAPAPTPAPGDPDEALWQIAGPWAAKRHYGQTKKVAQALKAWRTAQ